MERLTSKYWRNLDPWEMCGQDNYCKRGCHEQGGCTKGCIVPRIYARLAAYEDTGLEPEDLKKAFNETAILKLAAQALSTTPDHLRDLLQAEQDGRLVVLPFMLHSTMLNLSDPENLEVMKDVSLYVAWKSSSGIVFHSPYNCFLQDIEKGYIKADSEEAEAALKGGEFDA